jgi:CheY-like chemotaxis protein
MTKETQSRIFDPFFTTKEEGKGTGLGLAICRRIAEDHGAYLKCTSAAGKGTTFTLELPIAEMDKTAAVKEAGVWKPAPGKKVLVVDDEHEVVGMLKRMLESEGQIVDTAFSGPEAIERIKRERYDLVICDVEMGAVKGFSVREAMLEDHSTSSFIFTTGNYFNPTIVEKLKKSNVPYLCKPFTMADLLSAMKEVQPA